MLRNSMLVIRLSQDEHAAIKRWARAERLPASTLARQMLMKEAEKCGLLPSSGARQQREEVQVD